MRGQITLLPGSYGTIKVPRHRLERWARNFARMTTGIPIVVDTGNHAKTFSARHTAGRVTSATMTPEGLLLRLSITRESAIETAKRGATCNPSVMDTWFLGDGSRLTDTIAYMLLSPSERDESNPCYLSIGDSDMPSKEPATSKTLMEIRQKLHGKTRAAFDEAMVATIGAELAKIITDTDSGDDFNTDDFTDDDDVIVTQPEFAALSLRQRAEKLEAAQHAEATAAAREFNDDLAKRYPHRFAARS